MKYKIGDKVKIIAIREVAKNKCYGHIGTIATVTRIGNHTVCLKSSDEEMDTTGTFWYYSEIALCNIPTILFTL